jgi:flagellar basal-body rod protein FlgG
MRALDTAATGMAAQDLKVQVIAGNIANMGTTGFKSQRAEFQDLIYEHVQRIGAQASDNGNILPVGIEIGSGVKTVGTPRLMTQGSFAQTGNTLDVRAVAGVAEGAVRHQDLEPAGALDSDVERVAGLRE